MTFDGRFGQDLLVQRKKLIHDFIQIWYSMYIIIIYLMKNVSELYIGFNWDDGNFTKNQLNIQLQIMSLNKCFSIFHS